MKMNPTFPILFSCVLAAFSACAQSGVSADSLYRRARSEAFDRKDFPLAIVDCRMAVQLSPTDPDYRVFLGRLFSWTHQADSARLEFAQALRDHPGYEDACLAWSNLESWNGDDRRAIGLCEEGLQAHPGSTALRQQCDKLMAAQHRLRADSARDKIGISYDYIYFDRQFSDPWQLASLEYSRSTPLGSVIGWVNYANRFRENGVQFEAEAYPHISRTLYGYVDLGYSPNSGVFPGWRGGASLYANLPHATEADIGFRYLYFSGSTILYTFSLGKYYRNWWFNARCWVVPGQAGASQSVTVTARYYSGGADDYVFAAAGTGLSPDDNTNNVQLDAAYRLSTQKLQGGWRHAYGRHIAFASLEWLYQEYLPDTHGHQWDLGCGYLFRF
jgi:YaiO family outer membrane protein